MNDPQINVDHRYQRPTYHVVGLLTEHAEIPAISRELKSAGVDVAAVEILCGERGATILDEHGRYHELRARVVRAFQRLGYDEETLETYDEALRHGDLLLQVPVRPADRYHITARRCGAPVARLPPDALLLARRHPGSRRVAHGGRAGPARLRGQPRSGRW
jgi:hypothetical protein